jgi:hypothetical protein
MREELQAAIERAFIDLHYAEAELKSRPSDDASLIPAVAQIRLAIRELEAATAGWDDPEPPPTQP